MTDQPPLPLVEVLWQPQLSPFLELSASGLRRAEAATVEHDIRALTWYR